MIERRRFQSTSYQALRRRNAELRAENARLKINATFGCLTRNGLEVVLEKTDLTGRCCVYWDLDGMKRKNEQYGKPGVNVRIKAALEVGTRLEDCVTGQVFSGDEFCAFPELSDAKGLAQRMTVSFRDQDLPGTFIIVAFHPDETPLEVLERAGGYCDSTKALGLRDTIVDCR